MFYSPDRYSPDLHYFNRKMQIKIMSRIRNEEVEEPQAIAA
jgi:hypothetical protein